MAFNNSNQVMPLKTIKEESMIQNSNQNVNSKTEIKNKSQTNPASPVLEKEKNVNKNQHVSKKTNHESNQIKPSQSVVIDKKENHAKNNEKPLQSSEKNKKDNLETNQNKSSNSDDKEKTFYPSPIRRTQLDPEYKKKVLEKYKSYLIRDQCGRCKLLGIFVCEHNTTVRDSFRNRVLHEGTFYRSPRRSQSIEGKNSLIDRDYSPEKHRVQNKANPASKSESFDRNNSIQHKINEVKKTEPKDNHHEIKKP